MKGFLLAALCTLWASSALAQQENPNTFGRWDFHADNGMHGSVIINAGGFCYYTVMSAFSSQQSLCIAYWYDEPTSLIIIPPPAAQARVFTVPEYRDGQDPNTFAGQGDVGLSFQMTRFGVGWMTGHLLGAGEHVSVRFEEH